MRRSVRIKSFRARRRLDQPVGRRKHGDGIGPDVFEKVAELGLVVIQNPTHLLLPGYFVRVRVPTPEQTKSLLVPATSLGSDQIGRYVLVFLLGTGDSA